MSRSPKLIGGLSLGTRGRDDHFQIENIKGQLAHVRANRTPVRLAFEGQRGDALRRGEAEMKWHLSLTDGPDPDEVVARVNTELSIMRRGGAALDRDGERAS